MSILRRGAVAHGSVDTLLQSLMPGYAIPCGRGLVLDHAFPEKSGLTGLRKTGRRGLVPDHAFPDKSGPTDLRKTGRRGLVPDHAFPDKSGPTRLRKTGRRGLVPEEVSPANRDLPEPLLSRTSPLPQKPSPPLFQAMELGTSANKSVEPTSTPACESSVVACPRWCVW